MIWHEQLAKIVGVPVASPSLLDGNKQNYAYGGAMTGMGSTVVYDKFPVSFSVPNMGQQVTDYLANVKNKAPATNLYVLWGGGNDLRNVFFNSNTAIKGLNDLTNLTAAGVTAVADTAAKNIDNEIMSLIKNGATQFLWPDLPPINHTPKFLAVDGMKVGDGTTIGADLAAAVSAFNKDELAAIKALQKQFPALKIAELDDFTMVNTIITNVQKNGNYNGYTNVTSPAQGQKVDPDAYLFWDDFHPTVHAEYDLANLATQSLIAAGMYTVPEPSGIILVITGTVGIALGRLMTRAVAKRGHPCGPNEHTRTK